jgi:hypothetical protein
MVDRPDLRVTVRGATIRAVEWSPWLASGGPIGMLLAARGRAGVAIADVAVTREDGVAVEAIVRFLAGDREPARDALAMWARDVGYRRLWLPDETVELPGPAEGLAETRCGGCGGRFVDGDPGFWAVVRSTGCFPTLCPLCGGDLPQWRVRQNRGGGGAAA